MNGARRRNRQSKNQVRPQCKSTACEWVSECVYGLHTERIGIFHSDRILCINTMFFFATAPFANSVCIEHSDFYSNVIILYFSLCYVCVLKCFFFLFCSELFFADCRPYFLFWTAVSWWLSLCCPLCSFALAHSPACRSQLWIFQQFTVPTLSFRTVVGSSWNERILTGFVCLYDFSHSFWQFDKQIFTEWQQRREKNNGNRINPKKKCECWRVNERAECLVCCFFFSSFFTAFRLYIDSFSCVTNLATQFSVHTNFRCRRFLSRWLVHL